MIRVKFSLLDKKGFLSLFKNNIRIKVPSYIIEVIFEGGRAVG